MDHTLIIIGEIVLVPVLTFLTMMAKSNADKEIRRDKRDDGHINTLEARISTLETRLDLKEKEINEIRIELKNRDSEYVKLYQEHITIKAKYEMLLADHEELRKEFEKTVIELSGLKETVKQDRQATVELASKTASTI